MARPRMRPEFDLAHDAPKRVLMAVAAELVANERCEGTVLRNHAVIRVHDRDRHFWSPQLELEVRLPDADDEYAPEKAHLHGRFAPHPHVWTGFMALYALLAIAAVAGSMWGLSQWTLGNSPWALLAVPAAAALAAFVHGAVFIGQGLGAEQMYTLRAIVDRAEHRTLEAEAAAEAEAAKAEAEAQ